MLNRFELPRQVDGMTKAKGGGRGSYHPIAMFLAVKTKSSPILCSPTSS
jgi:hypothetical protein